MGVFMSLIIVMFIFSRFMYNKSGFFVGKLEFNLDALVIIEAMNKYLKV